MRDRRNTSLSISSASSSNSGRSSLSEKRSLSPPPATPLPLSPVAKEHGRKMRFSRTSWLKVLSCVCILAVLWRILAPCSPRVPGTGFNSDVAPASAAAAKYSLGEPGAHIVTGASGQAKWTVSIPHNASFPLRDEQYADICRQSDHARDTVIQGSRFARLTNFHKHTTYYTKDWTYLDGDTAQQPPNSADSESHAGVCDTSLTFVMDSDNASFGSTLLLLWLSYGLAEKEGRAFFVDDTRWSYGKYASYFGPAPDQRCSPPPPHQIVPCPHQAKHIVVSAATVLWSFGSLFEREYVRERQRGVEKYQHVFDLMRRGYEDLFHLIGDDGTYAQARVLDLQVDASIHYTSIVGMHIRRGDLHPYEYQFSRDYLPVERYASAANSLVHRLLDERQAINSSDRDESTADAKHALTPLIMASDDPDLFSSPALIHAASPYTIQHAQERIHLATKATLDVSSPVVPIREPGSAYVKHVDENAGWEGGFYSALFYSLGNVKKRSGGGSLEHLSQLPGSADIPEQAMRLRELVGRAYLLDLAVLGQSDGVVCAVSSAACRILGIMLGWDAVTDGRWVNVDDGRPWSWDGRR